MKPTKPSANEKRLAKLLREHRYDPGVCKDGHVIGGCLCGYDDTMARSHAEAGDVYAQHLAAALAKRGVLAVSAKAVPDGTMRKIRDLHLTLDLRHALRRLARGGK